jgi:ATP-dependent helicase/nuclease subunit A
MGSRSSNARRVREHARLAREGVMEAVLPDEASREAVRSRLDVSMLVEAGAGSGKTTLIVDRLLALVRSGVPVESIAAVTFTRKAANELRERLETQLERDAHVNARSRDALHQRERMFVGTIHAFCSRVIREHAIEAGIPPGFEELDDVGEAVLRERFWRAFIAGEQLAGSALITDLENVALSPRDLIDSFAAFHRYRDATFDAPAMPAPPHDAAAKSLIALDAMCEPLRARAKELRCPVFDTFASLMRERRASQGWRSGAAFARALRRLPRINISSFIPVTFFGRKEVDKEPMKKLLAAYERFLEQDVAPWEQAWAGHAYRPVVSILREASDRFAVERRRLGLLTFDDLLFETARTLRELPALRRNVSARWTHVLVDEFQDTDPTQAEIALLITSGAQDGGNWRESRPKPGSLFIVGDPKQSIYRFRRADIATYEFVKRRIQSCGEIHQLTSNFRSAPAIADFVNAHFSSTFPATVAIDDDEIVQAGFAPMVPAGDARDKPGIVSRYLAGSSGHQRVSETCADDAQLLASLIKTRIESGERSADEFLVLTSQRTRLQQYAREFARHSIPIEVNGANHDADALLQELVVVLKALADPSNPVRVIGALEGITCGASHAELFEYRTGWDITVPPRDSSAVGAGLAQLHAWWLLTQTLPAASVIERVVDDLALIPLMAGGDLGESRSGLLLHLIRRIREQHGDASSLDGALVLLDELLRAENTAPSLRPHRAGALRLMNLHRAKGLEANVVVLAAPVRDGEHPRRVVAWRDRDGSTHAALNVTLDLIVLAAPMHWDALVADDQVRIAAERDRLLYVATTRAREELIVAQRRTYESSGEVRGDEGAWSPLAPLLAEHEPLPLSRRARVTRRELDDIDLAPEFEAVANRRRAASKASFQLLTVTDVSKQNAAAADDDEDHSGIRSARSTADTGARLGMEMGSALHAVLNGALRGRSGAKLDQFIDAIAWKSWSHETRDVHEANRKRLQALVAAAMQSDGWKALQGDVVMSELPVAAYVDDANNPYLLEGIIDALSVHDGGAVIVDWKSAVSDERFAMLRSSYEAQVATYADIVAQRAGLHTRVIVQPVRAE